MTARARLPNRRASVTFTFWCNSLLYTATVSYFANGDLAEILRTNGSRSDHTQDLYIPAPVVVETVNGAARDAECLSRANIDFLCAKRPARHSFNTKNGFFVMVMAMCRRIQTVSEWDNELKG